MSSDRRTPLAVFLLLFFSYAYINQGWGWNQNSRLDFLHALFVRHTITIDAYEENTGDKEKLDGHFYSEKAPGMILIAAPSFLLVYGALHLSGIDIDQGIGWKISERVTTAGSVGLLAALGGMCLFLFLRRRLDPRLALIATLAVFLGSLPFPYATMMFSHGAIIGLFAIALWIVDWRDRHPRGGEKYDYLLGFVCGLAVSSEYPAAIGASMFFALTLLRGWKSAARFAIAAVPPLLTIPLYNWAVSGSFLTLGYSRVDFAGMQDGFFGVTLPKPEAVKALLFSHFRGLFFWSPFLLLSAAGYPALYRRSPRLFWITFLVPVAYVWFATSYAYWDGGFAFGPRHLSAAVPFLAVAAAFGLQALPITGSALAAVSILMTTFVTFINAMPPNEFHRPLFDFYPRDFLQGKMAWNMGRGLGLSGGWSMVLWAVIAAAASATIFCGLAKRRIVFSWHMPSCRRPWARLRGWGIAQSRMLSRIRFSPSSWIAALRRMGVVHVLLWAAIIGGIVLRFVNLPFMEFKEDEFDVLVYAWRNAHGIEFAQTSIPSSVGLMNPPFFVWLLSIPAFFTSDPVLITAFVAAVNVAGLLLLYFFVKSVFSKEAALWTTALLATAPWAIVFSGKLWAQDLLFPFMILFYFTFSSLMRQYRSWKVHVLFFALAVVTQLHFSTFLLPMVLFLFLDVCRVRMRARDLLGGMILFTLLYVPYILYQADSSFTNALEFLKGNRHPLNIQDFLDHLSWSMSITTGLRFDFVVGEDGFRFFQNHYPVAIPRAFFISYVLSVMVACVFLLRMAFRSMRFPLRLNTLTISQRMLLLIIGVYVMTIGGYVLSGIGAWPHYEILFYPLFPLLLALFLEQLRTSDALASLVLRVLMFGILTSNVVFTLAFYQFVRRDYAHITGDYETPYAYKQEKVNKQLYDALSVSE